MAVFSFLNVSSKRKMLVFLWSLSPWFFLAIGLHHFRDIAWSFILYHGLCLLPAVLLNRHHWQQHLKLPSRSDLMALLLSCIGFSLFTWITYSLLSDFLVDRELALRSLVDRGFKLSWFLPLSLYFLTVNPVLEELFWRGVVLNELCDEQQPILSPAGIWTNVAFAVWHFLVVRLFVAQTFVPLAVICVLSVGFFLSWLYRKRDSLILPALYHSVVFDLAVIIILTMLVFGPIQFSEHSKLAPLFSRIQG